MNEHEAARIAAAMNQARPDWPTKQLTTLLADPRLSDRPRRDVFVALAWVASEPNSANPYRVLEAGPWWRAAAIEGQAQRREVLEPAERCGICARRRTDCERAPRFADDEHTFEPDFKQGGKPEALALIKAELKAALTPRNLPDLRQLTARPDSTEENA